MFPLGGVSTELCECQDPRFEKNIALRQASSLTNVLSAHRDTYSDRSGSSTPDSEISELKLPSITNE